MCASGGCAHCIPHAMCTGSVDAKPVWTRMATRIMPSMSEIPIPCSNSQGAHPGMRSSVRSLVTGKAGQCCVHLPSKVWQLINAVCADHERCICKLHAPPGGVSCLVKGLTMLLLGKLHDANHAVTHRNKPNRHDEELPMDHSNGNVRCWAVSGQATELQNLPQQGSQCLDKRKRLHSATTGHQQR